MFRHRPASFLLVAFLAALVAFPTGRLTAPQPRPQPPGCPYQHRGPYCEGRDAFNAGVPLTANPYPEPPGDPRDVENPRRRWGLSWIHGQLTAGGSE
jgi:hypothetical protein